MLIARLVASCLLPAFLPGSSAAGRETVEVNPHGVAHEARTLKTAVVSWNMDAIELPKDKEKRHEYLRHVFFGVEKDNEDRLQPSEFDMFMIATAETGHAAGITFFRSPNKARKVLDQFTEFFQEMKMKKVGFNINGYIANIIYAKEGMNDIKIVGSGNHASLGQSFGNYFFPGINNKGAAASMLQIGEDDDDDDKRFMIFSAVHLEANRGEKKNEKRKKQFDKIDEKMKKWCKKVKGCKEGENLDIFWAGDFNLQMKPELNEENENALDQALGFRPEKWKKASRKRFFQSKKVDEKDLLPGEKEEEKTKCFSKDENDGTNLKHIGEVIKAMGLHDEGKGFFAEKGVTEACPKDVTPCPSFPPTYRRETKKPDVGGTICYQKKRNPAWTDRIGHWGVDKIEYLEYYSREFDDDEELRGDHVPVRSIFTITFERVLMRSYINPGFNTQ